MKSFFDLIVFIITLFSVVQVAASDNLTHFTLDFITPDTITADTTKSQKGDTANFEGKLDNFNTTMEKIVKYSPLPVISYSTETDWLFGLTKINSFRMGTKDQHDTTIQPSTITALGYYTLNKQYKFALTAKLMFGENKHQTNTEFLFVNFPEYYFGVGNETSSSDSCLVLTRNFSFTQAYAYKLTKYWYIGGEYNYNNYFKVDTVAGGGDCDIDITDLNKNNKGVQSGIGIKIARESRDNRFNAQKGSFLYFEYINYGHWIGSDFAYNAFVLEYRKYITPLKWLTIAGQIYTEAKFGDVPVQSLALMGGDNMMRGIYIGRFRDHTMIEGQVEVRFPIYWIFGGVLFTGLGEVAPKYSLYTLQGIKWTYGAGLRMSVHEATRTNIRFDVGFFQGNSLFFFTFSEAF